MKKRVQKLEIQNFRSFIGSEVIDFGKSGKNIFVFGENGVGKSSICKAFNVFYDSLDLRRKKLQINNFKNRHSNGYPEIKLTYSNNNGDEFVYNTEGHSENTKLLQGVRRTKGFIEYKNLIPIYLHDDSERKNNLFRLFVEGPFSKVKNPITGKLIGVEWSSNKKNKLPKEFHQGVFEIAKRLTPTVNDILNYFDDSMSLRFKKARTWTTNELYIEIILEDGYVIENYSSYLNEARLVAIAISIFLSVILLYGDDSNNDSEFSKILILDDIFIGMDMSNRLPFLKVLNDRFNEYQVLITTYDKHWFEVSKLYLSKPNWKFIEVYSKDESDVSSSVVYDVNNTSYTDKAWSHFYRHDYPACANYQRKAFEEKIKSILPINLTYSFNEAGDYRSHKLMTNYKKLIGYLEFSGLETEKLKDFELYSKIILNPLSHDNNESPIFKRELLTVFDLLKEFDEISRGDLIKINRKDSPTITVSLHDKEKGEWYNYKFRVLDNLKRITYRKSIGYSNCRIELFKIKKGKDNWVESQDKPKEMRVYFDELTKKHTCKGLSFTDVFKNNRGVTIAELNEKK